MADSVQYALDRMVVDLEELRQRGIFSEAEIRSIVSKRRDFEYMLQRHEARRLDYMRYVEHELNVESLRALRTRRIEGHINRSSQKKKKDKDGNRVKASTADFCCVRLVRWIFDRAVMKFPGDVDIWLHYVDFAARQGQSKTLGRLFARALQLHPRNAGLWIKAASWEFFDSGNASSARYLMQRGLRINPLAQNLWLQYFRLEFSYVEKLMGRREILGLDEEDEESDKGRSAAVEGDASSGGRDAMDIPELEAEKEQGVSGGPSFKRVKKAAGAVGSGGRGDGGSPQAIMDDSVRRFYSGAVPIAVFRAAIKAIPEDVGFRAAFLRCCAVDFPVTAIEAAKTVLASIESDFPESCRAWELRASYPVLVAEAVGAVGGSAAGGGGGLSSAEQKSVDVFERAVAAVGTSDPDMWVRYASFLRARLEACEASTGGMGSKKKRKKRKSAAMTPALTTSVTATALTARLRNVLMRAVEIHLAAPSRETKPSSSPMMATITEARKEAGMASKQLATRGASTSSAETLTALERRRRDDLETLSAGLADVCLALGKPAEALAALRAATAALPRRAGPWLRRAALERRLVALGVPAGTGGVGSGGGVGGEMTGGGDDGATSEVADIAMATLRAGLTAVPAMEAGYPRLWRELLASLLASSSAAYGGGGGGRRAKKKRATREVEAAFRGAVEACNPSDVGGGTGGTGGDGDGDVGGAGTKSILDSAQGEFLAGYIRWSAAVRGVDSARRALRWARRSFLLSGTGAVAAYNEAIELERALGEEGGAGAAERAKRIRELFEDATDKFGKRLPSIWKEYEQFEIQEGDLKRANAVRWRSQQP